MEPAKQIPSKHCGVTPGVTEMESDCEEWRILGRKCSTKQKRQAGSQLAGRTKREGKKKKKREAETH